MLTAQVSAKQPRKRKYAARTGQQFSDVVVALKKASGGRERERSRRCLTTESVESATLSLEGIDDVHGSHGLALGVLSVGDGIADHILKEGLENATGLFVDEARDTLDTTTASKTADGGLGNTLDVVTQDLAMTLGASLAEALASFSTSRHDDGFEKVVEELMVTTPVGHRFYRDSRGGPWRAQCKIFAARGGPWRTRC